jgi:hypothetical protein
MEGVKDAAKRIRGYVLLISPCARYEDKKKQKMQEWKSITGTSLIIDKRAKAT